MADQLSTVILSTVKTRNAEGTRLQDLQPWLRLNEEQCASKIGTLEGLFESRTFVYAHVTVKIAYVTVKIALGFAS